MRKSTKKQLKTISASFLLLNISGGQSMASPSTTYWTPCAMDIQGYKVVHVTYDNYTSLGQEGLASGGQAFPNDLGITVGVLPWKKVQIEIGVDWLEPSDDPLYFNAKVGAPEGALFSSSPAIQAGIFNLGTNQDVTGQNILHLVLGRSLPLGLGRLTVGGYKGNSKVLKSSKGKTEDMGLMAAYDYGFWSTGADGFNRLVLAADYATGDNALGGGGAGLYYYFTKDMDLLVGPVWFNDEGINGDWKWTTQLDVNF